MHKSLYNFNIVILLSAVIVTRSILIFIKIVFLMYC